MLESKLLARFDKYPKFVHSFDYKRHNDPLFREFFDVYLDDFLKVNVCDECYRL